MRNLTASRCSRITGHTFHDLIGTHHQQDLDLDKLYIEVALYTQRVMGPAHVENVLDGAIQYANRGVAHSTILKAIQEWKTSDAQRSTMNLKRHSANVAPPRFPIPAEQYMSAPGGSYRKDRRSLLAARGALGAREE